MSSTKEHSSSRIIEKSNCYQICIRVVDNYVDARNSGMLPEPSTSQILAMDGPAGEKLLGAFKTLYIQGRFSRTMVELALIHSSTSYPDYVQLWIRSLPPKERSMYALDLYNKNFAGIRWDHEFYTKSMQENRPHLDMTGGILLPMPAPPLPLGDNRHTPGRARIREVAFDFHQAISSGFLCDTYDLKDYLCPLAGNYENMLDSDVLGPPIGPIFGIQKSELVFGKRSDGTRSMSASERVLRCWNILYYSNRLCKTELEDALVRGPAAMKELLERGATLVRMTHSQNDLKVEIANALLDVLDKVEFVQISQTPLQSQQELECDYCGKVISKKLCCSRCKIALYCNGQCQKVDWKRHKPLCARYSQAGTAAL